MKFSKTEIIATLLVSLPLFGLALFTSETFYGYLLPVTGGGSYREVSPGAAFLIFFFFSLVLSLTPVLLVVTWRLSSIVLMSKKMASILIVITCMITGIILRRQMLISYFKNASTSTQATSGFAHVAYPVEQVHFEFYLFGGLLLGCVVTWLLFRKKRAHS